MRISGSLAGVREVGSLQLVSERESTEICVRLPCKFRMRAAVCCSCYYVACVASVVARCVRAVVAQLAVDSLAVVFLVWRTIAGKSRCSAPGHRRRIWVCVPLWLREPACGVAFTGARIPCKIRVRAAVGCSCCCVACVASEVARCVRAVVARLALDSLVVVFPVWKTIAGKSKCSAPGHRQRIWVCVPLWLRELACVWPSPVQGYCLCFVCRVASLVERCDTCLWLLSAWCRLVVSSGEVLPESFSVGSGGSASLGCPVF
ncbi:hypothetical protein Taro_033196 [Colocasia esculenta]|uniref:Uncharacterized protein n=1 Tax=Colocasia esculenta TaxID=4460 RepID=A0A843VT89_COLES|nr:hypothetical protein [Colocasia esculenta]